jgi:hypothetical protein
MFDLENEWISLPFLGADCICSDVHFVSRALSLFILACRHGTVGVMFSKCDMYLFMPYLWLLIWYIYKRPCEWYLTEEFLMRFSRNMYLIAVDLDNSIAMVLSCCNVAWKTTDFILLHNCNGVGAHCVDSG